MSPLSLIGFDLDGTLIDGLDGIHASLEAACAALQLQAPGRDLLRRHIGPPLHHFLPGLLGLSPVGAESTIALLFQHFRQHHDQEGWRHYRLYPGVPELLEQLSLTGCSLHVVTHKPHHLAERLLHQEGLAPLFDSLHAPGSPDWRSKADALRELRQNALLEHWYVGDTPGDQQAAQEAGYRFVAAGYGYGDCSVADVTIMAPCELVEVPGLLPEREAPV